MKKLLATISAGLLVAGVAGCLVGCGAQAGTEPKYTVEEKTKINLDEEALRLNVEDPENYSTITVTLVYAESHVCQCGVKGQFNGDHRQELFAHYHANNAGIVKSLNFTDAESVVTSDYGPFICYTYNSLEEFMNGDYEKLCKHNSDELVRVYIEYLIPGHDE